MGFRVGQRVKRIKDPYTAWDLEPSVPLHSTGTVTADGGDEYVGVEWDHIPGSGKTIGWARYSLAPLTNPDSKADEFIARIKKLATEPNVRVLCDEQLSEVKGGA